MSTGAAYTPQITGPSPGSPTAADGTEVTYFNATRRRRAADPTSGCAPRHCRTDRVLVVAQPLGDTESTLHHLFLIELGVTAGAVVVALLGGCWLVRLGLRPLPRRSSGPPSSSPQATSPSGCRARTTRTEVGRLARTLNVMLARIESAFAARLASERRLRASEASASASSSRDASHELRTPIAAVSAYAELFERGAAEQQEDLARVMAGIRTETARMEHLVADLLLLARLDEGRPWSTARSSWSRCAPRRSRPRDGRARVAADLRGAPSRSR